MGRRWCYLSQVKAWGSWSQESWEESSPRWGCLGCTAGILGSLQSEVWDTQGSWRALNQAGGRNKQRWLQTPRPSLPLLPGARFRVSLEEPAAPSRSVFLNAQNQAFPAKPRPSATHQPPQILPGARNSPEGERNPHRGGPRRSSRCGRCCRLLPAAPRDEPWQARMGLGPHTQTQSFIPRMPCGCSDT